MPRLLPPFVALLALIFAAPLHAQDDAPDTDPIVGTWVGIEMGGEEMPEGEFLITFNADGSGAFTERGGDTDPFTYAHDPDVKKTCTVYIEDEEPFSFEVAFEGDTMTLTPTDDDGPPPLKLQRVADAGDGEDAPAPPMPEEGDADTSILGRWVAESMDGEPVEAGEFVLVFNDDGTGSIIEGGDDAEWFTYTYDADALRCVIFFDGDEEDAFPIDLVFAGDTATFTPTDGDDVVVARRVSEGDGDEAPMPAEGAGDDAPLVGEWEGVSNNGEPVDPDDSVRIVFHADGTGGAYEDGHRPDPFTWSYDAEAETCTIVSGGDELTFLVSLDGDTLTFESEEPEMFLVMRRIAAEGDAADEDAMGDADAAHPEGVVGVWYAQRMEGDWVPADDEFRIEFRENGTAVAFENGEQEDDVVRYTVDEDRRIIEIMRQNGELEVELRYDLFDDVMVLTFLPPEGFEEAFEEGEMEILLCRRPEGNEEHQRMRAGVESGHPANGGTPRGRASRTQSVSNLRQMSIGIIAYSVDQKDVAPDSIGVMITENYLDSPETALAPWQEQEEPMAWEGLSDQALADWIDANTGYGYVGADAAAEAMKAGIGDAVLLFELPLYEGTEQIAIAFAEGYVESLPYDEADELIEEQTGRDLMGWMDHLGREQLPVEDQNAEGHGDHDHDHE